MSSNRNSPEFVSDWLKRQSSGADQVRLSVVIPAFNEQWRLPPTLIEMIDYFDSRTAEYEIVVVDDGSTDATSEMARKFERIRPQVRVIKVPRNSGKGYAVRTGVLNARGERILFADADGSTSIEEIERLMSALDQGAQIAIGSRALFGDDTKVVTRWYRKYLGRIFNFCVNLFVLPDVADTQCGFKLFERDAARFLFQRQRADGFSFDVELLFIARRAGLRVTEVPVNWENVPGSKVNLVLDSARMLRDVFVFRFRHANVSEQSFQEFLKSEHGRDEHAAVS